MKTRFINRNMTERNAESGFTLAELIIVMGIFIVVIMISAGAFERITTTSTQQIKSADSNIQGVVGLEMMRSDLEKAGYGLPYSLNFVANFSEANDAAVGHFAPGIDSNIFNDVNNSSGDANKVSRAVQSATAGGSATAYELGRDYLVIKATILGMNDTAKKWSYFEGVGAASKNKKWGKDDFAEGDQVIVLNAVTRALIGTSTTDFSFTVPALSDGAFTPPTAYQPAYNYDNYLVYGVGTTTLRFPYSRVDYYVKRPTETNISTRCAPHTGMLYKAVFTGGGVSENPLLDCVADMQIVYSLDSNEDGVIDFHGNENELSALTAEQIRKRLKEIKVYILTHEGQKDTGYRHSTSSIIHVGDDAGHGRDYDLANLSATQWMNYRWKIYTLIVAPKNLF